MSIFAFLNRNLKDIWVKVFKNGPSKVVCGRQPLKNLKWYGLYNKFIMSWTAHLNILVHDMINLLYYEYWTDKQKYLYVLLFFLHKVRKLDVINLSSFFKTLYLHSTLLATLSIFPFFDLKYFLSKAFFQRNFLVLQSLYVRTH